MDLIDREQAIKAIDDFSRVNPLYEYPWLIIRVIKSVPSAEKTGKWIEHEDDWFGDYYECSVCGAAFSLIDGTHLYNYCPNCGARMVPDES